MADWEEADTILASSTSLTKMLFGIKVCLHYQCLAVICKSYFRVNDTLYISFDGCVDQSDMGANTTLACWTQVQDQEQGVCAGKVIGLG